MRNVVLASNSPRRKEILNNFINFKVVSSNITEEFSEEDNPKVVAMSLAFQKAIDVFSKLNEDSIVIAADTIVYLEKILGKPCDESEALEMLSSLSGKVHYVYTGFSIIDSTTKVVDYVETKVKFKEISKGQIKKYINTNEPYDKAGAYAIQGIASIFIESIEGDFFNVVGLPIAKIEEVLKANFELNLL